MNLYRKHPWSELKICTTGVECDGNMDYHCQQSMLPMNLSPITTPDLEELRKLQPEDWPDIIAETEFYIRSPFCFPLKAQTEHCIAGMGAAIIYENTAWLAHIIVHPDFRNRGVGYHIVNELLQILEYRHIQSCLLIATELGRPVYIKAGFRPVTEYVFMIRENSMPPGSCSTNVISYNMKFREQILQMDRVITGENREPLLSLYMDESLLYVSDDALHGYYIPALKEGPVIADTQEAGLELMKIKCAASQRMVLPADNLVAIEFLGKSGFVLSSTQGTRMIRGSDIDWQPGNIYSRIGGNFG